MKKDSLRGFTVFFAVLVGSLALAIGLAIYELLIRELALSQVAAQSQFAVFAADAGAECALFWDTRYNGTNSAFATSSASVNPTSGITCTTLGVGQHDIAANGWPAGANVTLPPTITTLPSAPWGAWNEELTATSATTTFLILLGSTTASPCAKVSISKVQPSPSDPSLTFVVSRGYNTCANTGMVRVERAFQVSY